MTRNSLHNAVGAMVGAGVGAMRSGLALDDARRQLDAVSAVLRERPADLPGALRERLGPDAEHDEAIRAAELGVSAIPLWDRLECSRHGPVSDRELVQMAVRAWLGRPNADRSGWPSAERLLPYYRSHWPPAGFHTALPQDPDVTVGDVGALEDVEADAVVSLCRMGSSDVPRDADHVEAWLVDEDDPAVNPNLAFVLGDVAETIGRLRDEGKRVFVHCVRAESRTPAVAAAYLASRFGLSGVEALGVTDDLIPGPGPRPHFREVLTGIYP